MERTKKATNIIKFLNRSLSYLILLFSIFAVCYSAKRIITYAQIKKQNSVLEENLNNLKQENQKLEVLNSKLKDKDYFSVYVKDKYQYSSNSNSIVPID